MSRATSVVRRSSWALPAGSAFAPTGNTWHPQAPCWTSAAAARHDQSSLPLRMESSPESESPSSGLDGLRVVAFGGPKPLAALRELGVNVTVAIPEPNTWREVLSALAARVELRAKRIAIQEYGVSNRELVAGLEARGASIMIVPVYRWALPDDRGP